jgi:stage II sporulation protein D
MKWLIFIIILFAENFFTGEVKAENRRVTISLFNDYSVQTYVITPVSGNYLLIADGNTLEQVPAGTILYLSLLGDSILVRQIDHTIGQYAQVILKGSTDHDFFRLKPVFPALPARNYDDDVIFSFSLNRIQANNEVSFVKYLAGVVETEAGSNADFEFYKAQACLCRTYAYANLNKHESEGFDLCDGVHCQAYKTRCDKEVILLAVQNTHNLVIVTDSSKLITAAFHANCGGQTQNSEDEWLVSLPYLRSVKDPYCSLKRDSRWEVSITRANWIDYLQKNGYKSGTNNSFSCWQSERRIYYQVENFSLPFRKIRFDFKLRSSFFSVIDKGSAILLMGRGYGHGVGLCQDGAMQMAKQGESFEQIIHFYFTGVSVIEEERLPFESAGKQD